MPEKQDHKRKSKTNISRIILTTVGVAGLLAVAVVAPNAVVAMSKLGLLPGKRQRETIETARKRLVRQGLLAYENGFVRLTKKGEEHLRLLELKEYKIKKPKRWDHKWHVLIFDIPERRKRTRELIRLTLQKVGFVHLQDSVWVYPYECEELVALIKADLKIGRAVVYMVVEKIEEDAYLRQHFEL